ncbi:ABC transporter substrate-binding protein [Paenibacillus xylanexedens]|uniref:Cellobiose transport system substrate-binding protein n=1 Tax=Paenibacillus xylanexedens TaxID=528191 RepID=A0ABS4RZS0_PAEXY|nr:ABC transporter substrate-binding protein [Paenibacillus xylanexedens]MBP2248386.1 cellobiose transport system substrate-binding protein [Paenibacillus xylanexedens]
MIRRKRTCWTAILMVCVLLISGCSIWPGQDDSASNKKVALTLWYWNRSIDDKLIARAKEKFPNIELTAQKIGGDFKAKLKTTLAARSGEPDIVALNDWIMELFPSEDRFYNLYDLGAGDIEDQYLPWKWKQGVTPSGQMIGFPMDTGPTALFYREDLFKEAGLPSDPDDVTRQINSWDAYAAAGEQIKEKFGGKVFLTDNIATVYNQVISQSAERYFRPDGSFIGMDSPIVGKSWDTAVAFKEKGLLANADGWTPSWNAAMNNGEIASFVGAVWMKQVLQEAAPDTSGKWRVARAPGGDGNNGGSFLSILKSSEHPQEAFELVRWLQSPENQLEQYQTLNLFPSAPVVFDDPAMKEKEPFFGGQATGPVFAESAQDVPDAFFGERYPSVHNIITRRLNDVAKQNADPQQVWTDTVHRVERELQR